MASITSTSGSISSPGIGSGLDVNGIISQLMQAESARPTQIINNKQAAYQAKLSAIGTLTSAVSSFQTAIQALNDPALFRTMTASASNKTVLSALAETGATAGNYNITVSQLAQSQSISSAGQASKTATIGTGATTTLTFDFGSITGGQLQNGVYVTDPGNLANPNPTFTQNPNQASGTVTIDSTNNSLQGIRDAINRANLGVTASIVNDGSTTNGYHLVLTSNTTGATSNMRITASAGGDAAITNLLSYDPAGTQNLTQSAAGQNANFTVNGLAITSATNSVKGAIEGVTMDLAETGTSTLSVSQNTVGIQANLGSFVTAYNKLNTTIHQVTAFSSTTAADGTATTQAAPLLGDMSVRLLQFQLGNMLSTPLTNSAGNLSILSDIGISVDKTGVMTLDSSKLQTAMSNGMTNVASLFASIGTTTDSLVSYVSSNSSTPPGTSQVYISQLATQGKLVGSTGLAASTVIDNTNNSLNVTVDGKTATVSLLAGTYTPAQLAAQVQAAINGMSVFSSAGIAVGVSVGASNIMTITSSSFGSSSAVSIAGSGANALLGGAPVSTTGLNVAGTIGGVAGVGSGQFLAGASGSPASGVKLQITGGNTGARGTVTFSQGYGYSLNNLLNSYIGTDGVLPSASSSIQSSLTDLSKQLDALNTRLANEEANYRKQFTALDTIISKMNSTQSFLTQQLGQLSAITKQINKS